MASQLDRLNESMDSLRAEMKVLSERVSCLERKQAYMSGLVDGLRDEAGYIGRKQTRTDEAIERQWKRQHKSTGLLSERLGRMEQEQARMNGAIETIRDGLAYRVERGDAGERVAEGAESYEP